MTIGRLATQVGSALLGVVVLMSVWSARAQAQPDQSTTVTPQHHGAPDQNDRAAALVKAVREATAQFSDPAAAEAAGYVLQFGCVSGGDYGAMGVHFVNGGLVKEPALDVSKPELLVYEPTSNGRLRLVAADYLVLADAWHEANGLAPPELMGQLFHLFEFPNRFALPAFYTLHVWAWKENPNGTFVNWNPRVSCDGYTAPNR
jgi:hypothetical protein